MVLKNDFLSGLTYLKRPTMNTTTMRLAILSLLGSLVLTSGSAPEIFKLVVA